MTVEILRTREIDIFGLILSREIDNNLKYIFEEFSKLKLLPIIPTGGNLVENLQNTASPTEISEILKWFGRLLSRKKQLPRP